MALDSKRLADALKAAADEAEASGPDPLNDPDGFKTYLWEQIAGAIVSELQQNASVTVEVATGIVVQVNTGTGTGATTADGVGSGGIQ